MIKTLNTNWQAAEQRSWSDKPGIEQLVIVHTKHQMFSLF